MSDSKRSGLGVTGVLTLIFVVLKLVGVISWSWWWVFSPILIDIGLSILIVIICLMYTKSDKEKRGKDAWGILNQLLESQITLEDALRLESTPQEVQNTKEGKKLLRYLRWRRKIVNCVSKKLQRIF